MEPYERVWATLNHEEPDRVPIYEGSIEPYDLTQGMPELYFQPGILFFSTDFLKILTKPVVRPIRKSVFKLLRNPRTLRQLQSFIKPSLMFSSRLHRKFGLDLMGFAGGLPMILSDRVFSDFRVKKNTIFAPNGDIVTKVSENFGAVSRFGFLKSPEDYNKYIEMDPDNPINYFTVPKALEVSKGKIALLFSVFGAAYFEVMCDMFGFSTLFRLLHKDKKFIKRVVKDLSDYSIAQVEYLAERGVKLFYMSDDLGDSNRLMISPKMYNEFFKDGVAKFCRTVHKYGGKVIMHSCGNSWELIDTLIECGIDALHPWQPYANMDIFEGKKKFGKKITLIGNMSIEILSEENRRKDIINNVKALMDNLKSGGGYIFSSSHSIIPTVKWENA
ncbi:MAG: uroporphyrinogen decarboxylase family protein, partial [Candidatus Njordarchaeales archaeon]